MTRADHRQFLPGWDWLPKLVGVPIIYFLIQCCYECRSVTLSAIKICKTYYCFGYTEICICFFFLRSLCTKARSPWCTSTCAHMATSVMRRSVCLAVLTAWTRLWRIQWPWAANAACAPWTHPTAPLRAWSRISAWVRECLSMRVRGSLSMTIRGPCVQFWYYWAILINLACQYSYAMLCYVVTLHALVCLPNKQPSN